MYLPLLLVAGFLALAQQALGIVPVCSPVSFAVTASAENIVPASPPDRHNATAINAYIVNSFTSGQNISGTKQVSGSFMIKGTFCRPPPTVKPHGTLQLLVHGITYNRAMWTGLGVSGAYNWHAYATKAGYHTLSIDRLGHGDNPQRPDPFDIVQGSLHVAILHQITGLVRRGDAATGIPAFKRAVYIGHSYGSLLGNLFSIQHPGDIDAYVLTGFSSSLAIPPALIGSLFSAAEVSPRLAGLDLGYVTINTEATRTATFYAGGFDPAVAHLDFAVADTTAVEELLGPGIISSTSPYTGPVFIVTGDKDVIFCGGGPSTCAATLNKTVELYPSSGNFGTFVVPNSGHTLCLHYSLPQTVAAIHSWLGRIFPAA